MTELNVRVSFSSLSDIGLMTERVREDDVTTLAYEVNSCFIALLGLFNVSLDDNLLVGKSESSLVSENSIDEVEVVGRRVIVQADETDLEIRGNLKICFELGNSKGGFAHAL